MADKILALYMRLSLEDVDVGQNKLKDESNSIKSQRYILETFIKKNSDLSSMKQMEFVDDGHTGTNFDRPGFQEMIALVRSGNIKCIVVKDLSRFGRNYLEVGNYLEHIFPYLDVRFIAINDNYDSDKYIGSTGGIDIAFKNFVYERYSKELSEKVKASMHMLMKKGTYVTHCPYGYTKPEGVKHKMIPDPETAPVVKKIFHMAQKGKKTTEIARELNACGIPTPMQHKGLSRKRFINQAMWSHQAIIRIIQDYKYTGAMVTFKCENLEIRAKQQHRRKPEEYVVVEDMHEAIVTHDEFYAANETIRKVRAYSRQKSDTKDKVYICGYCGRRLRKTYGSDEYYSCPTQLYIGKAICGNIRLKRSKMENLLFQMYKAYLEILSDEYKKAIIKNPEDDISPLKQKLRTASSQVKSLEKQAVVLYEQYRSGELSKEDFIREKHLLAERKNFYIKELDKLNESIEEAIRRKSEYDAKSSILKEKATLLNRPDEELLLSMYEDIDRVIVYAEDEIDVVWKFDINFFEIKQ